MNNMEKIKKLNGDQFLTDLETAQWFYAFLTQSGISFQVKKSDVLNQAERKKIKYAITTVGSHQIMMIE